VLDKAAAQVQHFRTQVAAHRSTLSGLMLLGALVMLNAWGMRWMSDPYRFPFDVVEVRGEFRYLQQAELQAAIAPHASSGFFNVDVAAIRSAVEALPWVERAKVRRVWPATLRVNVAEQRPVATWNSDGYLNAAGEAFFPQAGKLPQDLPQLDDPLLGLAGLE